MNFSQGLKSIARGALQFLLAPLDALAHLDRLSAARRGRRYGRTWDDVRGPGSVAASAGERNPNPLESYFDTVKEGPGVWKWRHYFDAYHRHFQKFIGRSPTLVEIGIYSGGSLPMWRKYFGEGSVIHGVDIEPACRAYEGDGVHVHIGDQADRGFWRRFKSEVPQVDMVVDDGGHTVEQQMTTLEEMLPHIRPGGVFLCEDAIRERSAFWAFVHALCDRFNAFENVKKTPDGGIACDINGLQSMVGSIHVYPFVVVIEKRDRPLDALVAPKHGTQWQPFLG